jgi:hypothetical protein
MLLDRPRGPGEWLSDFSPLSLTYIQNFEGAARNFSFIFHGDDGDDQNDRLTWGVTCFSLGATIQGQSQIRSSPGVLGSTPDGGKSGGPCTATTGPEAPGKPLIPKGPGCEVYNLRPQAVQLGLVTAATTQSIANAAMQLEIIMRCASALVLQCSPR